MRSNFMYSRIVRNAGALVATNVLGRIIRFLYLLAIARLLGPEGTGLFVYGVAFYLALLGLANFGQDVVLVQRLGRSPAKLQTVASHSLTIVWSMTALLCALGFAYVWFTEPTFRTVATVGVFLIALAFRATSVWVRGCFIALQQATWIPRYECLFRGAEAVCGVAALLLGGGLLSICILHAVFWGVEMSASLWRLRRMTRFTVRPGLRRRLIVALLRASAPIALGAWMLGLFAQVAIIVLRQAEPDIALIGSFGIAIQFVTVFLIPPNSLARASLPKFNLDYRRGDAMPEYVLAVKLVLAVALLCSIAASAYLPWLIGILLGPKYHAAGVIVSELAWMLPSFAVVAFAVQGLNIMGGRAQAAAILTFIVAVQAGLLSTLLATGTISAAILSVCLAAFVGAILVLLALHRRIDRKSHSWWLKPVVAGVIAFGVYKCGILPAVWLAPIAALTFALAVVILNVFPAAERSRLVAFLRTGSD